MILFELNEFLKYRVRCNLVIKKDLTGVKPVRSFLFAEREVYEPLMLLYLYSVICPSIHPCGVQIRKYSK